MNHARLNMSLLVRTGIGLVILAGLAHLVHAWQMGRHARAPLAQPQRADLLELLARCHIAAGRPQPAATSLFQALRAAPDRASSAALLADLLRGLDQLKQADGVLNNLVRDNPRLVSALLARARHFLA